MNILLLSLVSFVVLYIAVCTFKYALSFVITSSLVATGSTLMYSYAGQSAMMLFLIVSPVLYIVVTDSIEKLKSFKLPVVLKRIEQQSTPADLVEAAPISGEWISGKTPELTFQQPLLGDVKALPRPWL